MARTCLFGHSAAAVRAPADEASRMRRSPWPRAIRLDTLPTTPLPRRHGWRRPDRDHLVKLLAYPMTILAGDQDIATDDPNCLGRPPCARPHRFARAQNYFEAGRSGRACRSALRAASATTPAPCRRSAPASGSMAACRDAERPAWPASRSPDRSFPPADTRYRHVLDPQPNSSSPASSPCESPSGASPWPSSPASRPPA